MRISQQNAAKIAILAQFAALLRCLTEYFRLKWLLGAGLTLARVEPFVLGALVAAVGALIGVVLFFWGRHASTVALGAVTVAILLALRFALL